MGLRKTIPKALESITLDNIRNYFDRVKRYMYGYLEGLQAGTELELKATEFNSGSLGYLTRPVWSSR